jgi:hypothetical protein
MLLVRYHQQPIGWVWITDLQHPVVSPTQLRQAIKKQLGWDLTRLVLGRQLKTQPIEPPTQMPISVIVYLPAHTDQADGCLQALSQLDYPEYEIVAISNDPDFGRKAALPSRRPVRCIFEEQPGLNRARNRGVVEACYGLIAFIDAAARPDRYWLAAIARAFNAPEVMAVTGLVAPAELETKAQIIFECDYGGLGRGFTRRTIRRDGITAMDRKETAKEQRAWLWRSSMAPAELLSAHHFGVGHNMAFRRDLFMKIGLFDVPAGDDLSNENYSDIEMFHRLVIQGYVLVYEPAVLIWQTHPPAEAELRKLAYNRGQAFGAYLLSCVYNRTFGWSSILEFAVCTYFYKELLSRLYRPGNCPRRLLLLELAGVLLSPLSYFTARLHTPGNRLLNKTNDASVLDSVGPTSEERLNTL